MPEVREKKSKEPEMPGWLGENHGGSWDISEKYVHFCSVFFLNTSRLMIMMNILNGAFFFLRIFVCRCDRSWFWNIHSMLLNHERGYTSIPYNPHTETLKF